jgi:hypothetical protein
VIRCYVSVAILLASLAGVGLVSGCSKQTYWAAPYAVTIRVKGDDNDRISGYVAQAFYKDEYERVVAALGAPLASSPRYLELLEMKGLKPKPLGDDGTLSVSVMRHGVDRSSPEREVVHEHRQEKVVLGVYYVDGSTNAFVFDTPPPGREAEIIAEIPAVQGEPSDGAESR